MSDGTNRCTGEELHFKLQRFSQKLNFRQSCNRNTDLFEGCLEAGQAHPGHTPNGIHPGIGLV